MKAVAILFAIAGTIPLIKGIYTEWLLCLVVAILCLIADYLDQILKTLKEE